MTIGLGGKSTSYWKTNKIQSWNGKEYAGLTETPYWNLMLDSWVLRIEKNPTGHMLFLPQEVVQHEVWTGGL